MSDFNYQPLFGATPSITPRVLVASFGGGYEQRVADGINNMPEVWSLKFRNTSTIIDTMYEFFKTKGAVTSFTWTPTGFSEITVICRSWSKTIISPNTSEISCNFEQIYGS